MVKKFISIKPYRKEDKKAAKIVEKMINFKINKLLSAMEVSK